MGRTAHIEIRGAVALVTGAGSGIGRSTALALAGRGATVLCADIDGEAAEKTAATCGELGAPEATAHTIDVADRGAVEDLAAEVRSAHGALGVLVNNAGVGMSGRFADMSADDWSWIRSVNLDGVVNGCAAFGPAMVARGRGHVVNLSSGLGYTPTATEPAYVTTKAAVLALSQCLRADWGPRGVGVTAVCPGVINTPIIDHTRFLGDQDDPEAKRRTAKIFQRGHKPEKVAAAIIDAVERDRVVVPVGFEARIGWFLHRLAPLALQQAVARGGRR
ncbi:MAG TPA: SDR family NAD(P)-dependent oxidoreductase [Acidimicrobiales bacterium]|nr:SDR family NAD(P)-dependent oxidoreductase [Acidimicrobiales bacterium]